MLFSIVVVCFLLYILASCQTCLCLFSPTKRTLHKYLMKFLLHNFFAIWHKLIKAMHGVHSSLPSLPN
ncbi:hypothetical protein GLYMA_06G213650v4 [Glycine max]|nr:hypothetical protein GLYMA_06G213650v4 [Glycine max]KAH1126969.1 hypothetical protein GYH30_015802 [Glycine max]